MSNRISIKKNRKMSVHVSNGCVTFFKNGNENGTVEWQQSCGHVFSIASIDIVTLMLNLKRRWSHRRVNDKTFSFSLQFLYDCFLASPSRILPTHPSIYSSSDWLVIEAISLCFYCPILWSINEKKMWMEEGFHCSSRKSSASTKRVGKAYALKSLCVQSNKMWNQSFNRCYLWLEYKIPKSVCDYRTENWFNKWCASDLWMGFSTILVVVRMQNDVYYVCFRWNWRKSVEQKWFYDRCASILYTNRCAFEQLVGVQKTLIKSHNRRTCCRTIFSLVHTIYQQSAKWECAEALCELKLASLTHSVWLWINNWYCALEYFLVHSTTVQLQNTVVVKVRRGKFMAITENYNSCICNWHWIAHRNRFTYCISSYNRIPSNMCNSKINNENILETVEREREKIDTRIEWMWERRRI